MMHLSHETCERLAGLVPDAREARVCLLDDSDRNSTVIVNHADGYVAALLGRGPDGRDTILPVLTVRNPESPVELEDDNEAAWDEWSIDE